MNALVTSLQAQGYELRQTHISWVLLGRDHVYKLKKPVDLGFLDFRTIEQRRRACEAEVRLNRRLADDIYRRVVPVTLTEAGDPELDGTGAVVDWAVEMRRLKDSDSAAARLAAGELGPAEVRTIAARIAAFHAQADTGPTIEESGRVESIRRNVVENFEQTSATIRQTLSRSELSEIESFQLGFLSTHGQEFEQRIRSRKVRDGHGDLRLEHVYLPEDEGVQIIDCIEFNDRFRHADVCADIAFLAMDLCSQGEPLLADLFLAEYAQRTQDYDLYRFVDFYASYRAYVRGKIATFIAGDESAAHKARRRSRDEARRYFLLAESYARPPLRKPAVYAVGGAIASGKTTTARALSERLGAVIIDSDSTRKHLAGVAPTDSLAASAFEGAYSAAQTAEVYAEVLRRAIVVLGSGRPVILEASFRSQGWRRAVRDLAADHHAQFTFIECTASEDAVRERLTRRRSSPSVTDGSLEVADAFAASFEPITELAPHEHVRLDTTERASNALDQITLGL